MSRLIHKKNDFYIDHIALGVSNTQDGMDYIENLTGVRPEIPEGQRGNWYASAALSLGNGTFLEVIGPNPEHTGFHPFKQLLAELPEPQLVFWYIGCNHFENAKAVIHENGFKLERHDRIVKEIQNDKLDYEIAVIGKGFYSEQPCLIQWHEVPERLKDKSQHCSIAAFHVRCQQAHKLNALFAALGMTFFAEQGENHMQLTLDTSKGLVELHGGGLVFQGVTSLLTMARLFKNHVFKKV